MSYGAEFSVYSRDVCNVLNQGITPIKPAPIETVTPFLTGKFEFAGNRDFEQGLMEDWMRKM